MVRFELRESVLDFLNNRPEIPSLLGLNDLGLLTEEDVMFEMIQHEVMMENETAYTQPFGFTLPPEVVTTYQNEASVYSGWLSHAQRSFD